GWGAEGERPRARRSLDPPPPPATLTATTARAATALAGLLADRARHLSGVNGDNHCAPAFASAWQARTGQPFQVRMRTRLYRLDRLRVPDPAPCGHPPVAVAAHRDLIIALLDAFHPEAGPRPRGRAAQAPHDRPPHR